MGTAWNDDWTLLHLSTFNQKYFAHLQREIYVVSSVLTTTPSIKAGQKRALINQ